jgi:hypothetical protein
MFQILSYSGFIVFISFHFAQVSLLCIQNYGKMRACLAPTIHQMLVIWDSQATANKERYQDCDLAINTPAPGDDEVRASSYWQGTGSMLVPEHKIRACYCPTCLWLWALQYTDKLWLTASLSLIFELHYTISIKHGQYSMECSSFSPICFN